MKIHLIVRILATVLIAPLVDPSAIARAQGPAAASAAPRIERFDLDPPTRLVPGEALIFRITGTPRSNASVSIVGVKNTIALREAMPGIYEGAYTIKSNDKIDVDSAVTGNLRVGNQQLSAVLGQPLVDVSAVAGLR